MSCLLAELLRSLASLGSNSTRGRMQRKALGSLRDRSGSLPDEVGHRAGLRHVDRVTARRSTTVSPARLDMTLRRRRDHLVVRRDQIPARLGLPGRLGHVAASAATPQGTCDAAMNAAFLGIDVGGERGGELGLVEEQEAVLRRQDRRHRRPAADP